MKQRLILFSALLIMSLLLGVASAAEEELSINITHNGTDNLFKPGEVVKVTAAFNRTIDQATISVNNSNVLKNNESMAPINGTNEFGGNSFEYDYEISPAIISGPLDLNISAFNSSTIVGSKIVDDAFVFNVSDYLDIGVTYNGTNDFRPGEFVNITASFTKPVDHANISIGDGLPGASNVNLVGASLVTDDEMTPLDDAGTSFGYDFQIPEGISGPLDIDVSGFDDLGNLLGDESFPDGFNVGNPYIQIVSPDSQFVNESCVDFNFSAYGASGSQITYAFLLDGVQKNNGIITSGAYKQLQFELADGYHTWEVKTNDGQAHTSGVRTLYVDTQCPSVKLISPADCYKEVIGSTAFNFTCEDAVASQYDLDLNYTMYVDGQPQGLPGDIALEDIASEAGMDLADLLSSLGYDKMLTGDTKSGEYVSKNLDLDDGVHYWYVVIEDQAGNNVTSEVMKFYVSLDGLKVTLNSPNGGFVPSNPIFNFNVTGSFNGTGFEGAGLPFNVKLLVDGKEVQANCLDGDCECGDCNECGGDENDCDCNCDDGETNKVCCTGGDCDESCFYVGENNYSVTAAVPDGVGKNWTVIVTDSTSGKTYQPNVFTFSVDSVAPASVADLDVEDAPGLTSWNTVVDYPGLMVSWDASTDKDLAEMPYEVYISTSKPSCIEDMQKVNTTGLETHTDGTKTPNQKLENSSVTDLCIEALDGKDLVYGKDYWVAVIARDNASNYNSNFSMCGPVRTYEDMDITLEKGWNLKSVPKTLVASNACSEDVFGNGSTVLYWDGSCWQFPETIEPCKGYWVYTEKPRTTNVQFKGMSADGTNPDVPASLTLTPGWHMIGHTAAYSAPWNMTLSSLNDANVDANGLFSTFNFKFSNLITYDQEEGWGGIISDMYDGSTGNQYIYGTDSMPVGALQSDNYMVPGQGYWIFMKNEGTYASIENTYNPY